MKILSYNIFIKMDNNDGVINFLKQNDFDIVALQESCRAFDKNVFKGFDSANRIDEALNLTHKYSFFAPIYISDGVTKEGKVHLNFGGKIEQGTQLLSKYEFKSASNKFYHNDYAYGFDATNFHRDDWTRSICVAVLRLENNKLVKVINVHGLWNKGKLGDENTTKQSNFIIEEALKDKLPVIILGDFNLLPEANDIKLLNKNFRNLCDEYNVKSTRPESKGTFVCDYVFVSDDIIVNTFEIIKTDISDHYPLVLDFDVN